MSLLLLLRSVPITSDVFEISAANLTKLRSDNQHSIPLLSIPYPDVVLTASLSALPAATDNSVVDLPITVVSGAIANVRADMTCLVMNGAETEVLGVVRVRKAPATGHLYISEDNYDITRRWVVGIHLLVLDEQCIWPKPLRVVDEDTFLMDWEITYTDEHEHPQPLIRFGPPIIPVLWDTGDEIAITINATKSIIPYGDDSIASWSWVVTGGAAIVNQTTQIPVVTVDATGRYRVSGTATTSAGKTATRHLYIEVYDKRAATRPPITQFELINPPEGSAEGGGWRFGVKLYGEASKTQIRDRALVCLFSRDWYSNIEESLGPIAGRENIVAYGWIVGESIEWDSDGGFVTFEVEGPPYWLEKARWFTFGIADTDFAGGGGGAPDSWVEMENLTVDKAVCVLAQEYSTLSEVCDVYLSGDARQASVIQSGERDLWSQLMDICYRTILALPAFDRYGRLHVQKNQQHIPLDERDSIPNVMDLTTDDHIKVTFTRRVMPRYSQAAIDGVYWVDGQFAPMGAYSPGRVPILGEEPFSESDLVVGNQADTLEWAGLIAGSGDGEVAYAIVDMPRNNRFFDIAPHLWATTDLLAADTERGMALTNLRLVPRTVRIDWDDEAGAWATTVECEGEGTQWGAVKMDFPKEDLPPIDNPVEPPEIPPEPPDGDPEEPPEPTDTDAVVATGADIATSADIDQAAPAWSSELNNGPTAPIDASLSPTSKDIYWALERESVWVTENLSTAGAATWSEKYTVAQFEASYLCTQAQFLRVVCSTDDLVDVLCAAILTGDADYSAWHLRSNNRGATWNVHVIEDGITSKAYTVTKGASRLGSLGGGTGYSRDRHQRIGDDENTYNPWAVAYLHTTTHTDHPGWDGLSVDATSILSGTAESGVMPGDVAGVVNDLLSIPNQAIAGGWMTDYFGSYTLTGAGGASQMALDAARIDVLHSCVGPSDPWYNESWVFWNVPSPDMPAAMDIAPTNNSWIYVGFNGKIRASEDGGITWFDFYTTHGANDLIVDPQLAGAVYYWSSTGNLNLIIKQTLGAAGVIQTSGMMTETALKQFGRIARSPNTGKLWGIPNGTVLRMRNLGSVADQKTGLSNGCGLHSYVGTKLIFVDQDAIWISDDDGTTITDKTGDWAAYAGGKQSHRMIT